ncbi:phosphatidylinositol 4-kinase beta 2 isoform X2 [Capsella rubella]|nr:phosphatidylinositol 4-kinase beta 2 isoform X2 [Capsella rubella]
MQMAQFLSLVRGESADSPREITPPSNLIGDSGSNGWLIRFFDSSFFCEWIAVSYLYKHQHSGVRDYLCNRMYTLPLSGIESYLFQICYLMVHKPSPSLDKFVIDICGKSLKIALKVHWFLLAELEDSDDNEGIGKIQEKCQTAATLMGQWSTLMRPQNEPSTPGSKNPVLNKFLSSKHKFFSLNLSPPTQKSLLFSPSSGSNLQDGGSQLSEDDNKIFKRLIPSPKVRDAILFRKSADKGDEESEKEGFFKRLMRDSRGEDDEQVSNSEGFFKRLLKENKSEVEEIPNNTEGFFKRILSGKGDDEELTSSADGFFKRLLRDKKGDEEELSATSESFFKKLLRENKNEDEEPNANSEGFFKKLFRESKNEDDRVSHAVDDEEKDGFLKKLFFEKFDDKKIDNERNETDEIVHTDDKSGEDNGSEGFFKKFFKEKFEDTQDTSKADDGDENEDDESSEFSLFKNLFRKPPEDIKTTSANENSSNDGIVESSPGTENFFRKLFRDRDRSVEDSELFGSKKYLEKCPGSPKQRNDTPSQKPPLPNYTAAQFRKGAYHKSLEFVHALCETSYDLVDIFPTEDRKTALRESLAEINSHLAEAETTGGICFPMGRGVYRVINIPEEESTLLNSREKVPYMICVEVLKAETPSGAKDASNSLKLSKGGIPLANGDAFLQKPPPWAYPLSTAQEVYRNSSDRMSLSTVQAIDEAMTHKSEVKLVSANLSVEKHSGVTGVLRTGLDSDLEWVRVVLTADPGLRMESIADPGPPRRKEHRRVPSIVAYEEVRAAAAKGEAPPGLPLKGAGQDSSDARSMANGGMLKAGDALSGEFWEGKRLRIRNDSIYGSLPGWDLRSIIVKSGDDCRQEHLAVQLISHFFDIFQEAGLPLWLRPYEVLVTSSYTALIETIPDTASIHSIKSRYPNITSLRDFFYAKFKENSPSFKLAQRNFVESMAGYSLVCYLLQIKDRHNGNLLMDEEGHIIHIDFGFMLSNSPGGVNFESAPFKLTRELLEVMDSDAEGVPSEFFDYFKVL